MDIARSLRCLQIDSVAAAGATTQYLVLWSRIGKYPMMLLDQCVYEHRLLFHYMAHAASLVLTEDFPIHAVSMVPYASRSDSWGRGIGDWMRANSALRAQILRQVRKAGPLRSREIVDMSTVSWESTGWNRGRNVSRMLEFLWIEGVLTIADRHGKERLWDLAERWFPPETPRRTLSLKERDQLAVAHALKALGVATPRQIGAYFLRGRYTNIAETLSKLLSRRGIIECFVQGSPGWFIHRESLPLLDTPWRPRTTLLSPFDNLLADRKRLRDLFQFEYATEIYMPATKRARGYYAMPILAGDRLVGSVNPLFDRRSRLLRFDRLILENGYRGSARLDAAIRSLARFVSAESVQAPAS